ncbi:hypothetical protein KGI31_14035 [Lactiplantibacillus pentosus]|uniref:hypothetical protein n=1 Tax=Lactiplantibacillus pentosus TaxID=1589 RepID=UPI001C1F9E2B|nr:hypothetical protein [Lactiplantibacillus pentosus]MBU7498019.1 hypothetical protein [Lactiplantibacillus pentosus]WNN85770.1 hypothetical protein RNT80_02220 [Lactiplantibacillus pentosus]
MKQDRHYKLGDNFIKMAPDQLIKLNRWLLVLFMAIEVVTWLARRGSHNVMVITLPLFCCAVIIYPIMRWVKWRKTTSKSHFHFSKDDFSGGEVLAFYIATFLTVYPLTVYLEALANLTLVWLLFHKFFQYKLDRLSTYRMLGLILMLLTIQVVFALVFGPAYL